MSGLRSPLAARFRRRDARSLVANTGRVTIRPDMGRALARILLLTCAFVGLLLPGGWTLTLCGCGEGWSLEACACAAESSVDPRACCTSEVDPREDGVGGERNDGEPRPDPIAGHCDGCRQLATPDASPTTQPGTTTQLPAADLATFVAVQACVSSRSALAARRDRGRDPPLRPARRLELRV